MSIESMMPSNHLILCHCPFFSCLLSFPASGFFFPMSWLLASGGQSIETSASASVLPIKIQDWFLLGLTDFISVQSMESQESSPTSQFKSVNYSCFKITLPKNYWFDREFKKTWWKQLIQATCITLHRRETEAQMAVVGGVCKVCREAIWLYICECLSISILTCSPLSFSNLWVSWIVCCPLPSLNVYFASQEVLYCWPLIKHLMIASNKLTLCFLNML